jgi:hypothetical protein
LFDFSFWSSDQLLPLRFGETRVTSLEDFRAVLVGVQVPRVVRAFHTGDTEGARIPQLLALQNVLAVQAMLDDHTTDGTGYQTVTAVFLERRGKSKQKEKTTKKTNIVKGIKGRLAQVSTAAANVGVDKIKVAREEPFIHYPVAFFTFLNHIFAETGVHNKLCTKERKIKK